MRLLAKRIRQWLSVPNKSEIDNAYRQLESLIGIYNLLNHNYAFGPLRGWAISPDALQLVLVDIIRRRPDTVVEFGSGQSTLAIAKVLTGIGGRLISFEHDGTYQQDVQSLLNLFSLEKSVSSILRPLVAKSSDEKTYDFSDLPAISPEVVLIDGPPGGQKNRLAPLRWAYENLARGGVIYLDDYCREHEKTCVELLRREFPDLLFTERQTEKQLGVIQKPEY